MKNIPQINDVFAADERFVHGFRFECGDPREPVQIGVTTPSDNARDESRQHARFRVLQVNPQRGVVARDGVFGADVRAIRLGKDNSDDPEGEIIMIYLNSGEELSIVGRMKLVFEDADSGKALFGMYGALVQERLRRDVAADPEYARHLVECITLGLTTFYPTAEELEAARKAYARVLRCRHFNLPDDADSETLRRKEQEEYDWLVNRDRG